MRESRFSESLMTDDWGKVRAKAEIERFRAAVVDAEIVDCTGDSDE